MSQFDLERLSRFHRMATVMRRRAKPLRAELRGYAPGDDCRMIDWRICARRDELLTKTARTYVEQRLYVLLNCSSGMNFGEPPKIRLALEAAAILACGALQNGNCLRLTAFSDRANADSPLFHDPRQFRQVLQFLGTCLSCWDGGCTAIPCSSKRDGSTTAAPTNDLEHAAKQFSCRSQPPGPVVIISDFLDFAGLRTAINILGDRGYSPRLVQIYAPCDADPSLLGDVELLDMLTGRTIEATITQRDAKRYRALFAEFLASIRNYCLRLNIPLVQAASNAPERKFMESVLQRLYL
jgi:uncharacterized protein (DUF58 family)